MQHKIKVIKLAYHFLGEGIILFLLLFPIFHYTHHWVPYWAYLVGLASICLLFSVYTMFTERFIWYILSAPVLFIIYSVLHFPSVLSGCLTVILTWRYIRIRKDDFLENEMLYVQWTTVLVLLLVLLFQQTEAIIYLMLQFSLLVIGYLTSHTLMIDKGNRKQFTYSLPKFLAGLVFIGIISMLLFQRFGGPIFQLFWDLIVVRIWHVISYILIVIASSPLYLWDLFNMKLPEGTTDIQESNGQDMEPSQPDMIDPSGVDADTSYLYWFIGIAAISIILFFVFKTMRSKFTQEKVEQVELVTHYVANEKRQKENVIQQFTSNFFKQPTDPIRKVVFRFERKADKLGKGREHYETLQEWLERIGVEVDIAAYERVRYGSGDITHQEVTTLKHKLHEWNT